MTETYLLHPTAPAGPSPTTDLRTALADLFGDLRDDCASVAIISATDIPEVFVQCIVTPIGVHLEAVSNVFLHDTQWALSGPQIDRLVLLGWTSPDVPDDPSERTQDWRDDPDLAVNWWQEVGGPEDLSRSADLLLQTLLGVYRLPGEPALEVTTFPADCQDWTWTDGVLEGLDG